MFCVYISVFHICENTWRSYFWRSRAFWNILPTEQPSFLILLADLSADLGNQPGTETHDSQTGLLKIHKNAEVRKNMLQSHPDVYNRLMSQTHEKQPNKTCTSCRSQQATETSDCESAATWELTERELWGISAGHDHSDSEKEKQVGGHTVKGYFRLWSTENAILHSHVSVDLLWIWHRRSNSS